MISGTLNRIFLKHDAPYEVEQAEVDEKVGWVGGCGWLVGWLGRWVG